MNLKDAIKSGKPFKHKDQKWFYTPDYIPPWMEKAISDEWETVEEIPEKQKKMEAEMQRLREKREL